MNTSKPCQPLTQEQIQILTRQGCTCADWSRVQVGDGFRPERVWNVSFSGTVIIGSHASETADSPGFPAAGLYNVCLQDVTIADHVLIRNVRGTLAHYQIEEGVIIDDVACLWTDPKARFGNGTEAAVVNENGNRSVILHERLCSQTAYFLSMYRHRHDLMGHLRHLIEDSIEEELKPSPSIGAGSRIEHCGILRNVKIGPSARLEGAACLENGTILSDADDPTIIGTGVIAKDFICGQGAVLDSHSIVHRCFIGQGVKITEGFHAKDSLFFSNSSFGGGQAASIFAGPFSVCHHKASLLIAGMVSFYNAGSGTNQSNHMYRLGPNQQGILERGVKTGSGSYLLWPARIGAFSTITGRHYCRPDTSDLPFSYLMERNGRSVLYPAQALVNIGLVRDLTKWKARDLRKIPQKADRIISEVMTPFTAARLQRGVALLEQIRQKAGLDPDTLIHQGLRIYMPERGIELYQAALNLYLGRLLLKQMQSAKFIGLVDLRDKLDTVMELGTGPWCDCAGLIAPRNVIETLLADIEQMRMDTLQAVEKRLDSLLENYTTYEWVWAKQQLEDKIARKLRQWSAEDLRRILQDAVEASRLLEKATVQDALREFDLSQQQGFGIDHPDAVLADFQAVNGTLDANIIVKQYQSDQQSFRENTRKMIDKISELK